MLGPQPDFEMGERTVPVKYLNKKSKEESRDMKDLQKLIFFPPKGPQK
jgi:hypothetical protein